MSPTALPYAIDRTVTIGATPDVVFSFFLDSERWARWWGASSTIEPRAGGAVYIRHPGGIESRGEVVEIAAPKRLVFTYGYVSGTPFPSGATRVIIDLAPTSAGTRLTLRNELPNDASRDEHIQGWRFQLSLFANAVANEVNANATRSVDLWFDAWADPDAMARARMLSEVAIPDVKMQDRFSNLSGVADILPHIAASQRFMPGLRMKRSGDVRHCQGMVLADWTVVAVDGQPRGAGTNVFVFGPTGRIEWVTGFWSG